MAIQLEANYSKKTWAAWIQQPPVQRQFEGRNL
jgi:hypothetical protein